MRVKIRSIYFYLIIPLLVISWVTAVNRFPAGYTFFAGDYAQPINIQHLFKNLPYVWNGRIAASAEGGFFSWFSAIPFYFVFYLLPSKLGLNDTQILSYLLFSFLSLYYLSFLLALKILFRKGDLVFNALFSLVYALNPMTLYFFTYAWGPSHQVFLYAFIPTLISLFIRTFETLQIKYIVLFLVVLFLSIPAYTNSAFALALSIHLFLVFLLASVLRLVPVGPRSLKVLARNLALIFFGSLLILSYWLLPTLVFVRGGLGRLSGGVFNLVGWLGAQSSSLLSIFSSVPQHVSYYPFKYESALFCALTFTPIFLFALALLGKNYSSRKRRLLLLFSVSYLVSSFLVKKVDPPFSSFSLWFFKLSLLPALRSYEKVAIFLPFSLLISGYVFATNLSPRRRLLALLALLLALVAVRPYFTGGIQTKYSIAFPKGKDYRTAEYSILTRIPDDYYELAAVSDKNVTDTKIQSMPFSPLNSISWVNYPKWKMIGTDPIEMVFSKNILSSNSSIYIPQGWHPHSFFSTSTLDPRWYTRMLSFFDVSEILYHKDVDDRFIPQSLPKVRSLEEKGLISVVKETGSAILYKMEDSLVLPHFYVPRNLVSVNGGVERLPSVLSFDDYELRSGLYLESSNLERADEVFMKEELENAIKEEDLGVPSFEVTLPYVRQKQGSLFYPLVLKKEEYDKWKVRKEPEKLFEKHLFYASKRVSEIMAFGVNKPVLANYKEEMTNALGILKKLKQEGSKDFVKLLAKYEGTLWGHRSKINELTNYSLTNWGVAFEGLEGQAEKLKVERDFSRLAYKFDIPRSGKYSLFINGLTDYPLLSERYFKEGKQELVLPFSGISENLIDENLRIKDYSPNSIYRISFGYKAPKGGSFFVAEGKTGETAETQLSSTGDEFRNFEMFFKSSPGAQEAAVHLSISVSEEKNLRIERIYQPEMILKSDTRDVMRDTKQIPRITFVKINPTKYRIKVEGAKEPYTLIFSESFHQDWKAYISDQPFDSAQGEQLAISNQQYGDIIASYFNGEIKEGTHKNIFLDKNTFETWGKKPIPEEQHLLVNGYANSWYITPEDAGGKQDYELIIEFAPQRLFYLGLFISGLTLFSCLGYLGYDYIKRRKVARNS